ncbi:MAG: PQQ-binding-like beta-propeller repeat protein [Thermoflexales bacterium]|nr:PQQ-binding-like beta-propeller repeat protein [Thermoflexales bacterium]
MYGYDLAHTRFSPEVALPPKGELVWRHAIPGSISSAPLIVDNIVYVVGWEGTVVALDVDTGEEIWLTQLDVETSYVQSLSIANDMLYVAGEYDVADKLYALDRHTGKVLWQHSATSYIAPVVYRGFIYRRATLRKDDLTHVIEVRDAATGKWIRAFPLKTIGGLGPVLEDHLLFTGDTGGYIYAFDLNMGRAIWIAQKGGKSISGMMLAEGKLYVIEGIGDVVAIKPHTGVELWRFKNPGSIWWEWDGAAAYGMVFVVGSNKDVGNILYALDAETGEARWQFQVEGKVDAPPAIANGRIYLGTAIYPGGYARHPERGKIYSVDAIGGKLVWVLDAPPVMYSAAPIIVNGVLYVGTSTGEVLAIR